MAASHSNQLAGDVGIGIPGDRKKGRNKLMKILPYAGAAMLAGAVAYTQLGDYGDGIRSKGIPLSNESINPPKAGGFDKDERGYIIPDFKLNDSYDFSDINDFVLALVEAEKAQDRRFIENKIMLPEVKDYSVGNLFSCRKYKIIDIRKASENSEKDAPEGTGNINLYEITMGSEIPFDGSSIKMVRLLVGERKNRFYLVREY